MGLSLPCFRIGRAVPHSDVSFRTRPTVYHPVTSESLPAGPSARHHGDGERYVKICYVVLVHHKLEQADRLIRRLTAPGNGFVVHIDAAVDAHSVRAFQSRLRSVQLLSYTPRTKACWGSYRQALAVMRCIETAIHHMEPFDRYVLLSGQDYPIASNREIRDFFSQDRVSEYLEALPLDLLDAQAPGWSPYFRFRRYHVWFGRHHGVLPGLVKSPPQPPIFHGSTSWALTREAVTYLAEQFRADHHLRRHFESSFLVNEAYIPTLMMSSHLAAKVAPSNVTHAEWTPTSGPHPKVLRAADFCTLWRSPKLFGRIFDVAVDVAIMDLLDERLDAVDRAEFGDAGSAASGRSMAATTNSSGLIASSLFDITAN